ncbi:MAG: ISNCY family transposase [Methylococcaceae bacterium]|nr:ISNCY family transposase [Methylococcaceae bacterium]
MRNVLSPQIRIGQVDIADIKIDFASRDDIPTILLGLQHIYTVPSLRKQVFDILEEVIPSKLDANGELKKVSANKGRRGMEQWAILVLGCLRVGLNTDHDRIQELANQHRTIREMLGFGYFDNDVIYGLQTIKDNLKLFTPMIMERINVAVINAGYRLLNKDFNAAIFGRCDSFVLETHVHFPTDISLLYDAVRTLFSQCAKWNNNYPIPEWRQHRYNLAQFKKLYRKIQKLRHSTSKDETKKQARAEEIAQAYLNYLVMAESYLERVQRSRVILKTEYKFTDNHFAKLDEFIAHTQRQIEQIHRRALEDEKIPHNEKVFSLFQPHTEWIKKGKAGVPVELGVRVCIMEDSDGFVLNHRVMSQETDDKIAVLMVEVAQKNFPKFNGCSFDKGFHSPANQERLAELLDHVVLPKKGKLSKVEKEREYAPEFMAKKRKHSAVESAINALEVHGLDTCPDNGIEGFERYVAMAVLSRNIQKIGAIKRDIARKLKRAA